MRTYKGAFISCRRMMDTAEMQAGDLIVSALELQRGHNAQPRQIYYAKTKALEGKTWDFEMWDRGI